MRFNIRGIPTLALFRGDREIARQAGAMDLPQLLRWASAPLTCGRFTQDPSIEHFK